MKTCISLFGLLLCVVVADALAQKGGPAAASAPTSGPDPVRFETRKLHKEYGNYCNGGPKGDLDACVWIDIEYPEVISAPSESAKTKINQAIQHWVLAPATGSSDPDPAEGPMFKTPEAAFQDFIDGEKDPNINPMGFAWWFKRKVKVEYESANVLSLSSERAGFSGGAHENGRMDYLNLRPSTGEPIRLQDIFKPGFEKRLNSIGEVRFRALKNLDPKASLRENNIWFPNNRFQLNDNFAIGPGGLTFQYNSYEITCFACGAPSVFLPYSDLRNLLRPDAKIP
jgi:hypothetical protein